MFNSSATAIEVQSYLELKYVYRKTNPLLF